MGLKCKKANSDVCNIKVLKAKVCPMQNDFQRIMLLLLYIVRKSITLRINYIGKYVLYTFFVLNIITVALRNLNNTFNIVCTIRAWFSVFELNWIHTIVLLLLLFYKILMACEFINLLLGRVEIKVFFLSLEY